MERCCSCLMSGTPRRTGTHKPEAIRFSGLGVGYTELAQTAFVLNKMKEVWSELGAGQGLSPKALKRIRKANGYESYEEAVRAAFDELSDAAAKPEA